MFPKIVLTSIAFVAISYRSGSWSGVSGANTPPRSKECDEKPYLADLLCELQMLDMFGMPRPVAETEIRNALDVDRVKSHIRTVYDTLLCSYKFTARMYMASVDALLTRKKLNTLVGVDPAALAFTRETSRMLATMFNVDAIGDTGTRNLMFIFYVHAEVLGKLFATAAAAGDVGRDAKLTLTVHRSVGKVLRRWAGVSECDAFNRQNRLDPKLGCDIARPENRLRAITFQKSLIAGRLARNAAHAISDEGWQRLSLKALTMNGVVLNASAMDTFFRTFPVHVDWHPVMALLKGLLGNATRTSGEPLSRRIRSLSSYQAAFVEMMKVAFVRLSLKYVTHLGRVEFARRYTYGKKYNDNVLDRIAEFEEYFQLRGDGHLDSLKKVFNKWIFLFAVQDNAQSVRRVLAGISSGLIKNDGLAGPMPLGHHLNSSDGPISIVIQDSVSILTKFMVHVKQMLSGINFIAVRSFIRIPSSKEYENLVYFETNLQI